jgi:hypothetical protein
MLEPLPVPRLELVLEPLLKPKVLYRTCRSTI